MKKQNNIKYIFFILVFFMSIQSLFANQWSTKLQKAITTQQYIQDKFQYVLNGVKRHKMQKIINATQSDINLAQKHEKNQNKRKSYILLRSINRNQKIILQGLVNVYYEHTQKIRKDLAKKYYNKLSKNQKALRYFRLALQEENRALSYKRINHFMLSIRTFQLARSYYFSSFNEMKIKIPDNFVLALNDLKNLPVFNQPPQIR